ncbi:translation initiation factor IF-3 [Candidatus Uhrbacteria bacterium RIFOXYA2_FULL_40_9]|nr:MAG: Translation initiation factor IF-3 [Candidatus Uhrbacteria bacterium GW2011_GWF2_40_263]OGL93774.1 MAG: translation initiation factor IF-3 [Candidatus Uhrbacteria bacterium RIFOXYA2_FULL_40_9]OGL97437.1 MAG: translation initiation factor IF-3 [Candidatus Uhrbacteria bacterium RIFOXYB2_FULL_41_18]HBK34807.1 translation initiation factor IF-3 [Candidatus Uhrbacteria bacterium]HCB56117.1 translation initiation factor IF-3 [Candidatus Uhrbacteria bacterium]
MRIHRHRQQQPKLNIPQYRINRRIQAEQVRVIDENGAPLGILPTEEAITLAETKELDLVEVSPKAEPPVCKILDFGQFKYQKEKEAKKQKAQSKEIEIKGIRLSVRIGEHDFSVRLDQALKFLERGDKVRIELPLRGRERAHREVANQVVERFIHSIRETYPIRLEQPTTYQGGRITAIVARS